MPETMQKLVDTHVHFVDPASFKYPWLESIPLLRRAFLPSEFSSVFSNSVTKIIIVEGNVRTDQCEQEVDWIESLVPTEPRIAAIVAFADLTNPDEQQRTAQLERLLARPLVRAIRHNIEGQPKGFCLQRTFMGGVRTVHRLGGHFELCVTHDQLDDVLELVRSTPDGEFVVNHGAKPPIKSHFPQPWRSQLAELGCYENVACKISGLFSMADLTTQSPDVVRPFTEHIVDCFGHDRVMYGSDWPVCTLAASAEKWINCVQSITASWPERARHDFYHDNAAKLYRIDL